MSGLRLCRDCRWKRWQFLDEPRCAHHDASPVKLDVVTGGTRRKHERCSIARLDSYPCGVDGILWKPRDR